VTRVNAQLPPPPGEGRGGGIARRTLLLGAALAACTPRDEIPGGFTGASDERGHLLRDLRALPQPAATRRTRVVIAGGGVAGLAAARALRLAGIDDFVLLELEDTAGGNSRPGTLQGIACPLGAHYLPVPGDEAREVQDLLEELGLRRRVAGRWHYDERHLVHSPQERLFFQGRWQEGLLPLDGVGTATLAQYRRFAQAVEAARRAAPFRIPMALRPEARAHAALDALTFAQWLDREGLADARLRAYLDYCCRDDYGAGLATVSAWAGLHYFAARHGFHPDASDEGEREAILTWPEGNGWLTRALAQPLGDRMKTGHLVTRIEALRHGVEVDAVDAVTRQAQRWQAEHCIVALPAFVAAKVVAQAPDAVRVPRRHAPWLVVNLHLRELPADDPRGPQIAWDNVIHGSAGLGYVVATHQSLDPRPGATVLSWYHAPGEAARVQVLQASWRHWRDLALQELRVAHPDLADKLTGVQVARYGHAMAIPVPGSLARAGAPPATARLSYAHGDWAGYSIFEEAFTLGHEAGARFAQPGLRRAGVS
jgi:protoporphyrinogen oxidase